MFAEMEEKLPTWAIVKNHVEILFLKRMLEISHYRFESPMEVYEERMLDLSEDVTLSHDLLDFVFLLNHGFLDDLHSVHLSSVFIFALNRDQWCYCKWSLVTFNNCGKTTDAYSSSNFKIFHRNGSFLCERLSHMNIFQILQ